MVATRTKLAVVGVLAAALLAAAFGLTACSGSGQEHRHGQAAAKILPERIIPAPRALLAVTGPQVGGTMWAVAGSSSIGLFQVDSASGKDTQSVSVSRAARSVAETSTGVVGIALGTATSGALELMHGTEPKPNKTVSLPAPALQVVTAASGADFYTLTAWPSSSSVTIVSSRGRILGSIPAPTGSVAIAADPGQDLIYVLQKNGLVDEIGMHSGNILSSFSVGAPGVSIAVSPDGARLYVLKGTGSVANIAIINVATEAQLGVLPAPSHCIELLVSPSGKQLYEVVASAGYGNIQVFDS